VRLSSPGPILFRQTRYGLRGRPFDLIKFRTMSVDSAEKPALDRPVTPVGRWLRRMHLDELPQLILILRGDMSLVGPRPKRADEARQLEQTVPLYRVRYSVRPGLTGWAQIRYRYAHNPDDEMTKLRYDLYYVKHQSFLLDLSILVRTAEHVLGMRGF
jgi:lipopolysaccharide/colanic/teichoic acid biosynthesis glycosyltransferase